MYNCIRMEFRKCFHSHNFIISMATCVLLALSSASYCCQGYLNIHDALDQYCFENGHMVSNELFPVWTSYNYWIGGESETLAYSAFYTLLPLFAILPHSLSCLQEKKSSYANQMIVRVGRQPYYLSKGIVCFFAAFITIVIPLILNFAVTAAFIPSTVPQINYEIYNHVYFGAMWAVYPSGALCCPVHSAGWFVCRVDCFDRLCVFFLYHKSICRSRFPVTAFLGNRLSFRPISPCNSRGEMVIRNFANRISSSGNSPL